MHLEILALRHELAVLQRRTPKRPSVKTAYSLLWVKLSMDAVALGAGHPQARNSNCLAAKRVSPVLALEE